MFQIDIDRDQCEKCLRCVRYCPTGALDREGKRPVVENQSECVGCGNCVDVCPAEAIQVSGTSDVEERGLWSRSVVRDIRKKAEVGSYVVRGTGATRPVPHFDELVILPAQTSRPSIDKYREPCNTGPDHMSPEPFPIFRIEDHLDETLRMACCTGLS